MIYVASSWRNQRQPKVVAALETAGLEVYDFRNPGVGDLGFHWSDIDKNWKQWTVSQYLEGLKHPLAESGFAKDMGALRRSNGCVLVLPCGRSAHLELGYAIGRGRPTAILLDEVEPELMNKMADLLTDDLECIIEWAKVVERFGSSLGREATMKQRIEFVYSFSDYVGCGQTITSWESCSVPRVGDRVWLATKEGGTRSYYEIERVAWQDAGHVKCVVGER